MINTLGTTAKPDWRNGCCCITVGKIIVNRERLGLEKTRANQCIFLTRKASALNRTSLRT